MKVTRRKVLVQGLGMAGAGVCPWPLRAAGEERGKVRIALIADLHQDVIHDASRRLEDFLRQATEWRADAVLELGDFCVPKPANRAFADLFESYQGRKFHVIGNHDTDGGFRREQVVEFHRMAGRYYSFDLGGMHGVVLDANDKPEGHKGGYPSHIDDAQIEWLRADLAGTGQPVFVFSHQSLERPTCIRSQERVRAVLEEARREDGTRKVVACINGHWHIDHAREIGGIQYIHLNSAAYYWVGSKFARERYSPEVHKAHPHLACTAPYRDPLFSLLEIDLAGRRYELSARASEWVGPSPQEMGAMYPGVDPGWVSPKCSARQGMW